MSTAAELLPFVTPLTDQTLSETDFSIAVDNWNDSLSWVLKLNTKAFWRELLQNASLSTFLNTFLGEYARFRGSKNDIWVMELGEILRRVFMIYHRISRTITEPEAIAIAADLLPEGPNSPGSALLDQGLISTPVLMDIAGIYGSSDPVVVSRIIGAILENSPDLITQFRTSIDTIILIIRRIQRRFEKGISGSGGGSGKGKGKGKGVSPMDSPNPDAPELDQEKLEEITQYSSALLNLAYALDSISAASPVLSNELLYHPTFLQCLAECYNYTLPSLTRVLSDGNAFGGASASPVLSFLRTKMLSIVNNILVGIDSSSSGDLDETSASLVSDRLCEVIINLYEQTPLQEYMVPMVDAPMILDLEIQFVISEKLSDINSKRFNNENDRLKHWIVMMSDLQHFNSATQSYIYEHNMRKSEKMARQIYLSEYQDRSSTTTISENNTHQLIAAPSYEDQEEDYVRRTMLISQLQDIFPDFGDGFLEACLVAFKDDPEVVTMRLLESDLPSDLNAMDRSAARSPPQPIETVTPTPAIIHGDQDVLASRRNIFDGDEFDVFSGNVADQSKISRGGKKGPKEAAVVLDDKSFVSQHKSAILQAVESMYDDEYDDTYDSMGLNTAGADFRLVDDIDANADEANTKSAVTRQQVVDPSIEHEEVLISMYTSQKELFNRSSEARRSKKRQELRNITKMSDEQLEGWAIMFDRNPRKAQIVQKYEFSGQQVEIEGAEPIDKRRGGRLPIADKSSNQQQQQRSQQRQQQQQQQGPKTQGQKKAQHSLRATPPPPPPQQQKNGEQQSKGPSASGGSGGSGGDKTKDRAKDERQKSSKANHNRRNQHAKKMAIMNS